MRSAGELTFRAKQELANLRLWLVPPDTQVEATAPLPLLPDPASAVERLQGSPFATQVVALAEQMAGHEIPLGETTIKTGNDVEWRRDYSSGIVSDLTYFRLVPYLDGSRVGNSRLVWELNRHQHLVALAQAWLFTRRRAFIGEIDAQIESWERDNPYMRGINWTSALEIAFRALSWLWVYHLAGNDVRPDTRRRMMSGLYRHGCYLEHNLSVYASPNTHLLGEAVALHAIGALLPAFDRAGTWRRAGAEVVRRQIEAQVMEDGAHFEQSSYYHLYALDFFLLHALLEPTDEFYRRTVQRMAAYLDAIMGRNRRLPLIGDDDGGRVFHPYGPVEHFGRATLATCASWLDGSWQFDGGDLHVQAVWWLGGDVVENTARGHTRNTSQLFRASGMAAMHGERLEVLVDAGRFGAGTGGHSHSDTLSVIASCDGDELLVDSGTFTYIADPAMRRWFRGSSAHNTVRIDERDQGTQAGPFRWTSVPDVEVLQWTTGERCDVVDAICRYGGTPHMTHRRRVLLFKGHGAEGRPDILLVCDDITGAAGVHQIEQHWRPATMSLLSGSHVRIGGRATLAVPAPLSLERVDGWRSRRFGAREAAPGLVVRLRTPLPAIMWAVLATGDDPPALTLEGAAGRRICVRHGDLTLMADAGTTGLQIAGLR